MVIVDTTQTSAEPAASERIRLDIQDLFNILPHRYPFLLIDRVLELTRKQRIVAIKNVTINEPFFTGHFPHHPVMPGVLIIEALAQTAAILSFKTMEMKPDENSVVYFVGIDNARFKNPVGAGDQLVLEVEVTRQARGIWKYTSRALVDGTVAAEADLMCTIRAI
jgi:3-hydroxyacyl-[acyl-carrier-protein] dehydratase